MFTNTHVCIYRCNISTCIYTQTHTHINTQTHRCSGLGLNLNPKPSKPNPKPQTLNPPHTDVSQQQHKQGM